jgi:hypothetical protein
MGADMNERRLSEQHINSATTEMRAQSRPPGCKRRVRLAVRASSPPISAHSANSTSIAPEMHRGIGVV